MRRNLSELEQKIILLLKRNSRMSIVDMASELGTSRITAKKALDSIISSGRIKKFTISLADEEKDMVLLYTDSLENIPGNLILERFSLIDGSYMVILYYEDLIKIKKTNIKRVEIATSRESYENMKRVENIRCDYCGKEIKNNPISVEIRGKTYYLCCPNCERDIKKRGEMILEEDSRH
ncbi:MAG: TRASH domain-containing protein [Candidatus Thermoplasmatota archaeon]|jgi:DNA-binding Lrp family transcriptional regulator|nr:TRASH domain-containing protein [Candidatus Thermoplasmatota archaeon]MCL5681369.1 TRASH domain-containing protein [Candidatus Thermoplasmatota archaeon]